MKLSLRELRIVLPLLVIGHSVLCVTNARTGGGQTSSLSDLSRRALPAILSVAGQDINGRPIEQGTGFLAGPGMIVTDYRVIKDAFKIHAARPGEDPVELRIAAVDDRWSVAILTISSSGPAPDKMQKMGESAFLQPSPKEVSEAKVGDEVFVFSLLDSANGSLVSVKIQQFQEVDGIRFLHLSSTFGNESIGSPVLNSQGYVVGLVVASPGDISGPGYAIPASQICGCGLSSPWSATGSPSKVGPAVHSVGSPPGGIPTGSAEKPDQLSASREKNASPPQIIRKSGLVLQGGAIRQVQPPYPALARAAGVAGSVVIEIVVDESGDVTSARAISGHPLLNDCAVAAVRAWKFTPTLFQEKPVKVIGAVTFNFTL